MRVKGLSIDVGFANMGFAFVEVDLEREGLKSISCQGLELAQTAKADGKAVRVSSDRLRRAQELHEALHKAISKSGARVAFAEIPGGNTQSATAAYSLGIAVGILASCSVPIIEVSPMEVKAAVAGRKVQKGASKAEIIAWAANNWPEAPWIRAAHAASSKGKRLEAGRLVNDNEHLADAMATVSAGIQTPAFKQLLSILSHAVSLSPDLRPSPRRERIHLL
ncbi:crossover junction endodeoxyribonuclease [Edwardsiella phage vB_EpM_ZHS]|nr:crossover junction endodeoxyribonuclease [Edwardsiella phage vB_EpM_ZHS]